MIPIRRAIRRTELFLVYRVLHANDTPHRLALGISLGFFVAWTPTIGFQMVLVLLLALALRANARVGLPIVWISNPFTVIPIYLPNYWLGSKLLSFVTGRENFDYEQVRSFLSENFNRPGIALSRFFDVSFWSELGSLLLKISLDLWIGSVVIGSIVAVVAYIVSYKSIVWYRANHPSARQLMAKLLHKHKQKL